VRGPVIIKKTILLGTAALFGIVGGASAQTVNSDTVRLRKLYNDEWTWRSKEMAQGGYGQDADADHLPKVDAATQQAHLAYWTNVLDQLKSIDPTKLDAEEEINYEVFKTSLEAMVSNIKFKYYEAPFNSDSNFWAQLPPRSSYQTAQQYRAYIARMRDIPRYFDEEIVNMQAGIKRDFTIPKVTLTGRDGTIVPFTDAHPLKNPFYAAFKDMPAKIPADEQAKLRADAQAAIKDQVIPSSRTELKDPPQAA
jgi:uncharacterized protein (DUF885 family)